MAISINYLEIPVKNIVQSKTFFAEAFDWTFTDYGDDYASIDNAGIAAGIFSSEHKVSTANGSILMVLKHDDLGSLQKKLEGLGGKIVKPIFSFPGGKRFHFLDLNGNEYAVWSEN
jgi:hypothetical protein